MSFLQKILNENQKFNYNLKLRKKVATQLTQWTNYRQLVCLNICFSKIVFFQNLSAKLPTLHSSYVDGFE